MVAMHRRCARNRPGGWTGKLHAVPMFYFNDGYPVPGAQEAQTFVRVMEKLKQRSGC